MSESASRIKPPNGWVGLHGPLLIAEIGGNHEGDFEYAKHLTRLAVEAGADVVKFQVYYADELVNPAASPDRHRHFKRFELTPHEHLELARMCADLGIEYLASVWSMNALDWLDPYLARYKVGSGDLTSHSMLEEFAQRGKPIILSTGLSTLDEVVQAVDVIRRMDTRYEQPQHLAVLQCTSTYPLPKSDANLLAIRTIREATGAAVGYSDHTTDGQALRLAAGLGAEVLEFHFTDTRDDKKFRDHFVSLTPSELRALAADLDDIALLLGDGVKRPLPSEIEAGHTTSFRRGIYYAEEMTAGQHVERRHLALLRPASEISAAAMVDLIGCRLTQGVLAGEPCRPEHFEPPDLVGNQGIGSDHE